VADGAAPKRLGTIEQQSAGALAGCVCATAATVGPVARARWPTLENTANTAAPAHTEPVKISGNRRNALRNIGFMSCTKEPGTFARQYITLHITPPHGAPGFAGGLIPGRL
jgi:hypothetical protein